MEDDDPYSYPICVKTVNNQGIIIHVTPCDKIAYIKMRVQKWTGMRPTDQCLMNDFGVILEDSYRVGDYGIIPGTTLTMTGSFQIFVKIPQRRRPWIISVNMVTKIDKIKTWIEERTQIPKHHFRLMTHMCELNDAYCLGDYYITGTINMYMLVRGGGGGAEVTQV
jgi:inorganic pyrophosphatase